MARDDSQRSGGEVTGRAGRRGEAPSAPPLTRPAQRPAGPGAPFPPPRRSGTLAALSGPAAIAAAVAGVIGLLSGPLMMAGATRYLVLLLAVVALVAGAFGVWGALRHHARLDYAVAGILMGAVTLYLWIAYVNGPPPGGT